MDNLTKSTPAPALPATVGPVCALCGVPVGSDAGRFGASWQRRLTDDELDAHVALEQGKRDQRILLADPQQPPPDFGPLPQASECTAPVYACGTHVIAQEAAALVHAKECTAPNPDHLPGCDCTPEPAPQAAVAAEPEAMRLPAHWIA